MSRNGWVLLGVAAAALASAHLVDWWAYDALHVDGVNERDWGRLLRVIGFAPTWLAVAAAFWLEGRAANPGGDEHRATARAVLLAVIVGGLGAEALKLLIRRERPSADAGAYLFRSFADDPFSTRRLGMPSSHAMVAFAGAAALARRYPRAAPVLYGLAAGCGLTRIMAQAHFVSDVVAAAIGGTAAGWWADRRVRRR